MASVSVEPDAFAVTANGAMPDVGDTMSAATGALFRIWTSWLLTASTLPALSHERNLTVVETVSVNGAVYVGLVRVGVVPFVV